MRLLPPATRLDRVTSVSLFLTGGLSASSSSRRARESHAAELDRLVRLVAAHELSVTWGSSPSRFGELRERLDGISAVQELALLGEADWLAPNQTRGGIVRRLNEATAAAEELGFELGSLLLSGVSLQSDFDLLAKHGVNLVLVDTSISNDATRTPADGEIRTLRFGLWQLAATTRLPHEGSRLSLLAGGLTRQLDRAIGRGEAVHLAVDVAKILADAGALRQFEQLLAQLARQQKQGSTRVQTLRQIAAELGTSRSRAGATSILRKEAA